MFIKIRESITVFIVFENIDAFLFYGHFCRIYIVSHAYKFPFNNDFYIVCTPLIFSFCVLYIIICYFLFLYFLCNSLLCMHYNVMIFLSFTVCICLLISRFNNSILITREHQSNSFSVCKYLKCGLNE